MGFDGQPKNLWICIWSEWDKERKRFKAKKKIDREQENANQWEREKETERAGEKIKIFKI